MDYLSASSVITNRGYKFSKMYDFTGLPFTFEGATLGLLGDYGSAGTKSSTAKQKAFDIGR